MQRTTCCRIFTPALPEYPAASVRDYCSGAYTYPADNQKTKDRAFARAVGDALDKGLMGSGLVDGATFFWRL